MLKQLLSSKGLSQLKIFLVQKKRNSATTVPTDVTASLTDSRKQTTYYLNTQTNIVRCRRKRARSSDRMAKNARLKGTAPYPDKEARFQ